MVRVAKLLAGVFAIWLVVLVILGFALGGRTASGAVERIGQSLGGTATVGEHDLALVRGHLRLEDVTLRRDEPLGKLNLDVGSFTCDLAPLGGAIFDRSCSELAIAGMRLELSTFALFRVKKPKRPPMVAERVVIRDATFTFLPSAVMPSLGRVQIKIEHAVAGPTTFKTPLSFLFALEELRASFELPAGITVRLGYRNGVLTAAGSLFGSSPIELPVALPVAALADDGRAELEKLVAFGKDLAEQLVVRRAKDWVDSKL